MSIQPSPNRVLPSLVALALIALGSPAVAEVVGGGGSSRSDCLVVFDAPVNVPERKPRNIRCADGEACDADGTVNGTCEFPIGMCANSTFNPAACTLAGVKQVTVEHAADNGDPKFDPELQALEARFHNDIGAPPTVDTLDECFSAPTNVHVALKGPFAGDVCKKQKKRIKVVSESKVIAGKVYVDTDTLTLTCDPPPSGCDPAVLYSGTFDRIQRQVFNQSCALSGCHDSQSQAGNLLLEEGAALAQLADVTPTNDAAADAGWKRLEIIDAMTGDPATSLIVHKLNGDFPGPGFGERMPFGRPKLDQTLIDVVTLWVAAGAPETGWVPGTD